MSIISNAMFPFTAGFQNITNMKDRFEQLQGQMATGQKAATLAEMGSDRYFNMSMRSRIGKIATYQDTITTVNLRLDVIDKTMQRLDTLESDQRALAMPGSYGSSGVNLATGPDLSMARLDETLNLLNASVDGRYLMGGSTTDTRPMEETFSVVEGAGGRAGFRTVMGQRKLADTGTANMGRLTLASATDTVTLTEDGAHPFGYKLSTLATSSASVALTQPAGMAPQTLAVQFTALPLAGQSVSMGFELPDGTEAQIELTATTATPPGANAFTIGADEDTTAANFAAALQTSIQTLSQTTLQAASTFAAAKDFFNGQGEDVMRVNGPPYETATALVAATSANTVFWYKGEDNADPRGAVQARIEDNTNVKYGVQANEKGIVELVRALAAFGVESYPDADTTSEARFDAMAERQQKRLSEGHNNETGSLEVIAIELGMAKARMGNIAERMDTHDSQLKTMLEGLEGVSKEEVAMEMMALQTRLEASYQAVSLVSQLSLVKFI